MGYLDDFSSRVVGRCESRVDPGTVETALDKPTGRIVQQGPTVRLLVRGRGVKQRRGRLPASEEVGHERENTVEVVVASKRDEYPLSGGMAPGQWNRIAVVLLGGAVDRLVSVVREHDAAGHVTVDRSGEFLQSPLRIVLVVCPELRWRRLVRNRIVAEQDEVHRIGDGE